MASPDAFDQRPHIQPQSEEFQAPEWTYDAISNLPEEGLGSTRTRHRIRREAREEGQSGVGMYIKIRDKEGAGFRAISFGVTPENIVVDFSARHYRELSSGRGFRVVPLQPSTVFLDEIMSEYEQAQQLAAERARAPMPSETASGREFLFPENPQSFVPDGDAHDS